MQFSTLSNILNKHRILQTLLVFSPFFIAGAYSTVYIYDMSGVAAIVDVNNSTAENGNLMRVKSYEIEDDGRANVVVASDEAYVVDVKDGDYICSVYALGKRVGITSGSDVFFVDGSDLNYIPCDIYLDESGDKYKIVNDDGTTEYTDFLNMMDVVLEIEGGSKFLIDGGYTINNKDSAISYCTVLKDDELYFDIDQGVFLRNLGDDFVGGYLKSANFDFVLLCVSILTMLLVFIYAKGDLVLLKKRYPLYIDVACIAIMLGIRALTFLMFE